MGPKKGNPISEVILPLIHQVACIQMNLSDAYLYLVSRALGLHEGGLCSDLGDDTLTNFISLGIQHSYLLL